MAGVDRQCTAVILPPLIPWPQHLLCPVRLCAGWGGWGGGGVVKPISMQIVMTSCFHPSVFFSPHFMIPGGCWEGCLSSEWVSVAGKLLCSQSVRFPPKSPQLMTLKTIYTLTSNRIAGWCRILLQAWCPHLWNRRDYRRRSIWPEGQV